MSAVTEGTLVKNMQNILEKNMLYPKSNITHNCRILILFDSTTTCFLA